MGSLANDLSVYMNLHSLAVKVKVKGAYSSLKAGLP